MFPARAHRRIPLAGLLIALLAVGSSVTTAEVLPKRIEDAAFWRMVTDFSETGGSFTAENFVSNERNFQQILTSLRASAKLDGAYIGVGPEQNFTYIVAVKPRIAFIVDIRQQNLIQHLMYKALFELSADRAEFLSLLFSRKRPGRLSESSTPEELLTAYSVVVSDSELAKRNRQAIEALLKRHGFALSPDDIETLEHVHHIFEMYGAQTGYSSNLNTADFTNGRGDNGNISSILTATDDRNVNRNFLANEENFRFIKDIEAKNLVIPVVGDFGGDKALRAIASYLKAHETTVSAFYVSNVEQYLFQNNPTAVNGGARNFYENVAALPLDDSSTFIRSFSSRDVPQPYPGFNTQLGSMLKTLQVFREKGFQNAREVIEITK